MSDTVQLMLVVECSPQSLDLLATALGQCHASCILIRPAGALTAVSQKGPDGAATGQQPALDYDAEVCAAIVALSQSHQIAALVANDVVVAKSALADGCHLDATDMIDELYASAREVLGRDAIVGVMPGPTRHMAMTLAEAGCDYVSYDVSTNTGTDDDLNLGLVAWWAEIFESPVVAFCADNFVNCRRAIEAGPPDFVALSLRDADDLARLNEVSALIAECGQLPIPKENAK